MRWALSMPPQRRARRSTPCRAALTTAARRTRTPSRCDAAASRIPHVTCWPPLVNMADTGRYARVQGPRDTDGAAVVTAKCAVRAGEEITISYIDEDVALADREEALRDYGFSCQCPRCRGERSAEQTSGDGLLVAENALTQ